MTRLQSRVKVVVALLALVISSSACGGSPTEPGPQPPSGGQPPPQVVKKTITVLYVRQDVRKPSSLFAEPGSLVEVGPDVSAIQTCSPMQATGKKGDFPHMGLTGVDVEFKCEIASIPVGIEHMISVSDPALRIDNVEFSQKTARDIYLSYDGKPFEKLTKIKQSAVGDRALFTLQ